MSFGNPLSEHILIEKQLVSKWLFLSTRNQPDHIMCCHEKQTTATRIIVDSPGRSGILTLSPYYSGHLGGFCLILTEGKN